eukprot:303564-Chlamydomonas_euryale.AAC.2
MPCAVSWPASPRHSASIASRIGALGSSAAGRLSKLSATSTNTSCHGAGSPLQGVGGRCGDGGGRGSAGSVRPATAQACRCRVWSGSVGRSEGGGTVLCVVLAVWCWLLRCATELTHSCHRRNVRRAAVGSTRCGGVGCCAVQSN